MSAANDNRAGTEPGAEPPDASGGSRRRCPICGKPTAPSVAPFCSKRCADVDLHRWLGGTYAITTEEVPPDDER